MTETSERALELSAGLQRLIDDRLDGIDRALRGAGLPRGERIQILEDVERQLLDMLAEVGPQPNRRDVLQALAKLDPPEAYLSDEPHGARTVDDAPAEILPSNSVSYSPWAIASGAALALTIFLAITALMAALTDGELIIYVVLFLAACAALVTMGIGSYALAAPRRDQRRGTGIAAAAVVVAAWLLALAASYLGAVVFESELLLIVMFVLKDLPFGVALIWCLRSVIKKSAPAG